MIKHVEVYRNLHNGKLSVRDRKTKRVVAHVDNITLAGVCFRVSQAGRERVLREGRKNVHAFVSGKVVGFEGATPYKGRDLDEYIWEGGRKLLLSGDGRIATYNPYKYDCFVIPQEGYRRIQTTGMCHIDTKGVHLGETHVRSHKPKIDFRSMIV